MSRILDLADAIAEALEDYDAEVAFIPDFDLKGAKEMRVVVVPAGIEFRALSRAAHEEKPCIHVGIIKKATQDDVPALVNLVQQIGKTFLNLRLGDSTCADVAFNPVYSPSHLREKGLFVSVMELTFKAVQS